MAKTIYILGNGFDLDIGLKTSYKDFIENTYKGNKPEYTNQLIDDMVKAYNDANWIDIEAFLRSYALSYNEKDIEDRCIKTEYEKLSRDLNYYMSVEKHGNRDIYNRVQYKKSSAAMKLLSEIANMPTNDFHIYSFNYTDLNAICNSSNINRIDNNHITYVHGTATSSYPGRMPPIILGIDEIDVKKAFYCMIKPYNSNYQSGIIKSLQEAEHVIFFGVGFGITDAPYFKGFFSGICEGKLPNRKIDIYTREDDSMILGKIKSLDSNIDIATLKENCKINIYQTNTNK